MAIWRTLSRLTTPSCQVPVTLRGPTRLFNGGQKSRVIVEAARSRGSLTGRRGLER